MLVVVLESRCVGAEVGAELLVVVGDRVVEEGAVVLGEGRGVHGFFGEQAGSGRIGVGRIGVDDADGAPACGRQVSLLASELLVVGAGGLDGGGGEQGVESCHPLVTQLVGGVTLRLVVEVLEDVGDDRRDVCRVHVRTVGVDPLHLAVVDTVAHSECVDVVDTEGQDGLVPDGVDDGVGVQLVPEGLLSGAQVCFPGAGGVFRKDGCAGEAEEVIVAERARDVGVHVAELAAVAFVEDEDDVPGVDGVAAVCLDEGGELLDGRDDDRDGCVVDLFGELSGGLVRRDRSCGEGVVFLDGLVVQILAVDDEEDLVDAFHASGELRRLEGGEGLPGTRRVPDVSSGCDGAGLLVHGGCLDALEDRFGGGDLVGPHDEELVRGIEDAVAGEDCEDGALGQEGSREVSEVGDLVVGGVGPPIGEFVGVGVGSSDFAPVPNVFADVLEAHGVGVVLGLGAVGDNEDLYVAEEAVSSVEGVTLVAVDLVEGFAQFLPRRLSSMWTRGSPLTRMVTS